MKIKINKFPLTKKSCLLACFFACMFVFASFTRKDRQRVREFKKELMSQIADKKTDPHKEDERFSEPSTEKENTVFPEKKNWFSDLPQEDRNEGLETGNTGNTNTAVSSYSSREKEGTIGTFSDKEEDQISDNFFTIDIPDFDKENTGAYLEYELFGLASHESVPRSINHNIAVGGNIVVPDAAWSLQKEAISMDLVKKGVNTILFTQPSAGVKYKIKNLKLIFTKENNSVGRPIVSSILAGEQLYVKGNNVQTQNVMINNQSAAVKGGEFEKIVVLSAEDKKSGSFSITSGGTSYTYKIPNAKSAFRVLDNSYAVPKGIMISNDKEFNINYENMNLSVQKETSEAAYIEVLKLREKDFPALAQGMKNVTLSNTGYRLSVISGKLNKKVKLTIPYDEKRLGLFSPKDISVFHFDYAKKQWVGDKSVVDVKAKTVTVEGDGDNDYINGIISVPESPQLGSSSPTSISGLKAADPMAGMQLLNPPSASQKGDANMNYAIKVPAGAGGLQPSLSISYNSSAGNGWMGEGWDVQGLSTISVDTRWGTPAFDASSESELYTLDGEMLVYPNGYLPHRHNNINETSDDITTERQPRSAGTKQFYLRKNHDFTLIQRNGDGTGNYEWVVTSTDGTKSYYGGSENAVLKNTEGKIVLWALRMVEDSHQNTMRFTYQNNTVTGSGTNSNITDGKYFHIQKITYGRNQDYAVTFNTETGISRKDISINAKQGMKRVEPYLLNDVVVSYKASKIRTYHLEYEEGQFSKTRLKRFYIKVPRFKDPSSLPVVDDYKFEYFNEIENNQIFGPDTALQVENKEDTYGDLVSAFVKPSKINGNISSEKGLNFRAAAGLNFYTPSNDAYGHLMFGFPFGFSTAEAKNAQQLVDFNGDGIQDMLYRIPNKGLYFSQGVLSPLGRLSFLKAEKILNFGNEFSFTETKTNNSGWDMGAMVVSKSEIKSTSTGTTSIYMIDANSDGLVDIVENGQVWFNRYDKGLKTAAMTKHSEFTENMVVKAKPPAPPITAPPGPKDPPIVAPEYPPVPITDVVKVWIAPKDGYISVSDKVGVLNSTPSETPTETMYYSVEIPNPNFVPGSSQPNNFSNARIYLTELKPGDPIRSVSISRYNDYYSQIENVPPVDPERNKPGGINNSNRLFVKSNDKIYIRLHKSTSKNLEINSRPNINYVDPVTGSTLPNTPELTQDQFRLNNGAYGARYLVNNLASPVYLDADGTADINVKPVPFYSTSDSFTFKVLKENAITGNVTELHSQYYPQSDAVFNTLPFSTSLSVSANEPVYIRFVVESDSQTSFFFNNIESTWNNRISIAYNAVSSGTAVNLPFFPAAQYPSFAVTQFREKYDIKKNQAGVPQVNGINDFGIQINKNVVNFSNLGTGNFYYIIKQGNKVLGKRKVTVVAELNNSLLKEEDMPTGQEITGVSPILFYTGDLAQPGTGTDHQISIQVYCKTGGDYALYNKYSQLFSGNPFTVYYGGNNSLTAVSATSVNTAMYNTKSAIYHNWGQFLYTPGDYYQYTYGTPIKDEAFAGEYAVQNTFSQCQQQPPLSNQALSDCILNATNNNPNAGNNTVSQYLTPMKPITRPMRAVNIIIWGGTGTEQFATATSFKNDEEITYLNNPIPGVPPVVATSYITPVLSVDSTMKAISKKQSSSSRNKTEGASVGGVSAANSITTLNGRNGSIETQTFSDLNGDGYPDMIYPESVQFTNSAGGLDDMMLVASQDFPTNSYSFQKMNSIGFSYNAFSASGRIKVNGSTGTSTQPNTSMPWSGGASIGAGINDYYDSTDYGKSFWMDVNGDGLPDRVLNSGTSVSLNLGKSLSGSYMFENMLTYSSHPLGSTNVSVGGNLGSFADLGALSNLGFGISASLGGSASKGSADVVHEDINGDGLIDIVEVKKNPGTQMATASVRYNLGNKFGPAVQLLKASGNLDFTEESGSYNGYFSFGGHFMFNIGPITLVPPLPILILFIKAGAGATANLGINVSETKKAFRDMNGDGFADLVVDTNDGFIVNYSLIGKTNKLKTVTHQLTQGRYTLDYQFTQPNYEDPHAKLVVKEIKVLNPDVFSADYTQSNDTKDMTTRYTFENSKYDRRERDNFGFATMTTEELDIAGEVYRKTVDTYHNTSYFLNGLLKQKKVMSGAGGVLSESSYNYKVHKFKNNITEIDTNSVPDTFDTGGTEGRRMATVLLEGKTDKHYENSGDIQTSVSMKYNQLGQIKNYRYTSPTKTYNSEISYWAGLSRNMIGVAKQIDVYDGTGNSTLLRRRKTLDPNTNTGDIGKYAVFNGTEDIETEFTYDSVGNVASVKYPPNEFQQHYTLFYKYDPETGKNVTEVYDAYNYKSLSTYHPFFDAMETSTDVSGNITYSNYDEYGRIVSVKGPNEGPGTPPTILHQYYFDHYGIPNSNQNIKIFRATTSHYDADNPYNSINTDSYSDFMGRVIQVKKDIAVNGIERRSVSGRSEFDIFGRSVRQFHPLDEAMNNNNLNTDQSQYFTSSVYDLSDRVIAAQDEEGNVKTINFAIDGNLLKTTEEFYNMKTETFMDIEGKVARKNNYLDNDPFETTFKYNAVGELIVVTDPENIETVYEYDLAGRRTAMTHADKGRTTYKYDAMGHMTHMTTANLANDPNAAVNYIHYLYDQNNRLSKVILPNLPSGAQNPNNVEYVYMAANSGNNSGKVITKTDGTGYTTYNYGKMGEITSETRRVFGYNTQTMEFKTEYVYDSWNRIKQIKYPDSEQLFYTYDQGGNLKSVSNGSYNYIQNIAYDLYEQRKEVLYGNGTKSFFSYSPKTRRLSSSALTNSSSQALLANNYRYDPVGNITELINGAEPSPNMMAGIYSFRYFYDTLNRLIGTDGQVRVKGKGDVDIPIVNSPYADSNAELKLKMTYNRAGGIVEKDQDHKVNQLPSDNNAYTNGYKYIKRTHMVETVYTQQTGYEQKFEYDFNGNVVMHRDKFGIKQMFWDEQDRLKAFYNEDSGVYQYNAYDDKGERTIKYSIGGGSQLYQNGELVDPGNMILYNYKLYPNPYVVVTSDGQYTKHYFEGSTRFASRVMDGNDMFIPNGTRAATQNTNVKEPDPGTDFKTYLEKAGLGTNITSELAAKAPGGQGGEPGLYYLHGDHLGSASFVTDHNSVTTQFFLNLPFGETMLEQSTGIFDNRYQFNAKEMDKETGLYYYGARYYNPSLSIWYGVDPLAVYNPVMETEFYGDGQHNDGVYFWGNNNPYIYTYENPINLIDPNGKQTSSKAHRGGGYRPGIPIVIYKKGGIYTPFPAHSGEAIKEGFDRVVDGAKGATIMGFTAVLASTTDYWVPLIDNYNKLNKWSIRILSSNNQPNFVETKNGAVNKEVIEVADGRGSPRLEEDGSTKVFRGDQYKNGKIGYGSQKNWIGAEEFNVPKSKNVHDRILRRVEKDGTVKYGYSQDIDYKQIHEIKQK